MISTVEALVPPRTLAPDLCLANYLDNQRWVRREKPFPHIIATDVFKKPFYDKLASNFYSFFSESPNGAHDPGLKMRGYDAYGIHFSPDTPAPFSIFTSRAWHDMLASLFNVQGTGYINCGLHHHSERSASGLVHNDLAVGWFADYPSDNGIRLSRNELCRYTDGTPLVPNLKCVEMVRAVSMLYYLANPPWRPGDGGETGLYKSVDDRVDCPAATVPPINNSMILFECTPLSFHSFLSNTRSVRNSAIMWIHRSKSDAVARWGDNTIVRFPRG